jgi:hypothetical protein
MCGRWVVKLSRKKPRSENVVIRTVHTVEKITDKIRAVTCFCLIKIISMSAFSIEKRNLTQYYFCKWRLKGDCHEDFIEKFCL